MNVSEFVNGDDPSATGDVALTEPWYRGIGGYFSGVQEQFVEDGSWTRLRELTVSYSLRTPKFIKSTKLSSIDFSFFCGKNGSANPAVTIE